MRLRKGEFELDGGVGREFLFWVGLLSGFNVALYQDFLFSRHCVVYVPLFLDRRCLGCWHCLWGFFPLFLFFDGSNGLG